MSAMLFGAIDATALASAVSAVVVGLLTFFGQEWRYRRESADEALQTLERFRQPLLRSAYSLQSRLYNIGAGSFLGSYWNSSKPEECDYARWSTLWLFAQYLGWVEILRREIEYLDLGSNKSTRQVQRKLNEIAETLSSDKAPHGGKALVLFRADQRAVGELMVTERSGNGGARPDCLGYSEFVSALAAVEGAIDSSGNVQHENAPFVAWLMRYSRELDAAASAPNLRKRLTALQHDLIELVDLLDPEHVRFPRVDYRKKLSATADGTVSGPSRV